MSSFFYLNLSLHLWFRLCLSWLWFDTSTSTDSNAFLINTGSGQTWKKPTWLQVKSSSRLHPGNLTNICEAVLNLCLGVCFWGFFKPWMHIQNILVCWAIEIREGERICLYLISGILIGKIATNTFFLLLLEFVSCSETKHSPLVLINLN